MPTPQAEQAAPPPDAVDVVCVPAGHPYVASSIATPGRIDEGLFLRPDVIPADRPTGQWWPPVALDPLQLGRWLGGEQAGAPQLVHVHFGFEGVPLADLEACLALLHEHRVPLVVTVHDLRNPHLEADEDHAVRLDALVRAADGLVTLTDAAADRIRRRWGREATVIPHPHVAPLERIASRRPAPRRPGPLQVALSLKSLRANTLAAGQVAQVADVVGAHGDQLSIGIHPEALEPGFIRHDPAMSELLRSLSARGGRGGVTVVEHQRLDDRAFLDDLAAHDVVLLPYRFGTHSGILEACRDVGSVAIAPTVGCYRSQAPCPGYDPEDIPGTLPGALEAAARLLAEPGAQDDGGTGPARGWFVDRAGRREQAGQVRAAHRRLYAQLLHDRATGRTLADGTMTGPGAEA